MAVIRPLLCTTHDYIIHYLRDIRHIDWVEDSTNSDTHIRRNSIREELSRYQKAEIEHIAQTARIMQGYVDWMEGKDTLAAREVQKYEKERQ
jgi:tRNA(Ile)-lysidine synthase TilS/MesJ